MGTVFFISPLGEIIPGEINHINTVIKYSDKFGYTRDRIEEIYKYHNERVGLEGKARLEIIVDLERKAGYGSDGIPTAGALRYGS